MVGPIIFHLSFDIFHLLLTLRLRVFRVQPLGCYSRKGQALREGVTLKRQMTNGKWLLRFLNFLFKRGTGKRRCVLAEE